MKCCDWCGEPLVPGDTYLIPLVGDPTKKCVLYHSECHMRQFTGSVAHLGGYCGCRVVGSTCNDPPHMTRREAARAAVAAWEVRHELLDRQNLHGHGDAEKDH